MTIEEKEWVGKLYNALEKLPCYEGDLNRSLTFKFEEDAKKYYDSFVVGKEYIPKQFLSTTKLAIENEVLYSDSCRFIILNKVMEADKYWILLEEL